MAPPSKLLWAALAQKLGGAEAMAPQAVWGGPMGPLESREAPCLMADEAATGFSPCRACVYLRQAPSLPAAAAKHCENSHFLVRLGRSSDGQISFKLSFEMVALSFVKFIRGPNVA